MEQVLRFTNFSEEDFVVMWNKEEYEIKAGDSVAYPAYLVMHFAKHLIDREINAMDGEKYTNDVNLRNELMSKCVGSVELKEEKGKKMSTTKAKAVATNINAKKKKKDTEEFEGAKK